MRKLLLLTCSIMVLCLATKAQPELLVYYKFDDTTSAVATDSSGNDNDGTFNITPNWVEGKIGCAMEIMDTQSVTVPDLSMTSSLGTVAFWMNCKVPTTIYTMFWAGDNLTGGGFGAENEMHFHLEKQEPDIWAGGELSFFAIGDSNLHIFSDPEKGMTAGTPPVNPILMGDSTWHHVAASWGFGAGKLYIDGELIMEKNYYPSSYALTNIFLGKMANGGRRYIGKLDEVRIYSEPLTDQEVADIYADTIPQTPPGVKENLADALQLYAFPNPASQRVTIRFRVDNSVHAIATLYDVAGREIATLYDKRTVAGNNFIYANVTGYSKGIYYLKLQVDNRTAYTKLVIR